MLRNGLDLGRPVYARAPGGSVGRAPRAQRFHAQTDGAGTVPHVFVSSVAGRPGRAGGGVRWSARSGLGGSSLPITG